MISDILFEALEDIEAQQKESPRMYEDIRPMLNKLKKHMRSVLSYLDAPPGVRVSLDPDVLPGQMLLPEFAGDEED